MQLLILALLLLPVPVLIGGLFVTVDNLGKNIIFRWISGQFLLWAGFQMICVPLILKERSFAMVVKLFLGYMLGLALLALAVEIQRRAKGKPQKGRFSGSRQGRKLSRGTLTWLLFFILLVFQLVQAVRLTYADSDDAYYVAVSSVTESSDTMYQILPYTGGGGGTKLDIRHGLAPFPIWIAFLARLSGMQTVTLARTVLPVVLMAMTYAVFYLLGTLLFPGKEGQLPLFLVFTEVLVLFGNYSIYTVENFLIARSRQGKAALGSLVIPFLLLLLLLLLQRLQEKRRVSPLLYLLTGCAAITGCLCSTMGALLLCLALCLAGLLAGICLKRPGVLFPLACCCVPCVCYAFLYFYYG